MASTTIAEHEPKGAKLEYALNLSLAMVSYQIWVCKVKCSAV